jgi:hypothetical protein
MLELKQSWKTVLSYRDRKVWERNMNWETQRVWGGSGRSPAQGLLVLDFPVVATVWESLVPAARQKNQKGELGLKETWPV